MEDNRNFTGLPSISTRADISRASKSARGRKRLHPGETNIGERTQSAPSSDEVKVRKADLRVSESLPLISPAESKAREARGWQEGENVRGTVKPFERKDFHVIVGPGALGLTFGWTPGFGLTVVEVVELVEKRAAGGGMTTSEVLATSELEPQPHDVLVKVNETHVGADVMDFGSVVSLMKEYGNRDRDLVFRRFGGANGAFDAAQIAQVSQERGDGGDERQGSTINVEISAPSQDQEGEERKEENKNDKRKMSNKKRRRGSESKVVKGSRANSSRENRRKAKRMHSIVSPMAMLQQGLQQMQRNAEAMSERRKKVKVDPFIGAMCKRTKRALELADSLQTLHVSITNRSYYYHNRNVLGSKKLWHRGIRRNKNSYYEGTVFVSDISDATGELGPSEKWVGSYETYKKAVKKTEREARIRDRGDMEHVPVTLDNVVEDRLSILVVSPLFEHKSNTERLKMIYECLLGEFYDPARVRNEISAAGDELMPKNRKWKKYGVVGTNVLQLPQFRFIDAVCRGHVSTDVKELPVLFAVEAKTPSQWRPDVYEPSLSDRFGQSHDGQTSIGVSGNASVPNREIASMLIASTKSPVQAGKDRKGGREKRRFSHFYHDMPANTKSLMNVLHQRQSQLIYKTGEKAITAGGASVTGRGATGMDNAVGQDRLTAKEISGTETGPETNGVAATKGTVGHVGGKKKSPPSPSATGLASLEKLFDSGAVAIKQDQKFDKMLRRQKRVAISLQRIYRLRAGTIALRSLLRDHRKATDISRVFRGHVDRSYAREFRRIRSQCALKIQSTYRMFVDRVAARRYRFLRDRAARRIQPVVRGWFARRFVAWKRENEWAAVKMTKIVRGFLARCEFKRRLALRYLQVKVYPAVRRIQRVWRGYRGRLVAKQLRAEKYQVEVVIPAAIAAQKFLRRYHAQKRVARLRLQREYAIKLQKVFRGHKTKRWFYEVVLQRKKENENAVLLQSIARLFLASRIVRRRLYKKHHKEAIVPSAIKLQSVYRRFSAKKFVKVFRKELFATRVLQKFWKAELRRRAAIEKLMQVMNEYRFLMASRLQAIYRGWKGRRKSNMLRQERDANRILAAVKIQNTWKVYVAKKEVGDKLFRRDMLRSWKEVKWCHGEIKFLISDLRDVELEQKKYKKLMKTAKNRIKEVKKLRREKEKRIPVVEQELWNLDEKDVEEGWDQAFQTEWDMLNNEVDMMTEELYGKRNQVKEYKILLEDLQIEADDYFEDLDELCMKELTELEQMHYREISKGEEYLRKERAAKIRKQKNRWRIKTHRSLTIERINGQAPLPPLPYEQAMTIDSAKRQLFKQMAKQKQHMDTIEELKAHRDLVRQKGNHNVVLRAVANETMNEVEDLMKRFTFDYRRPKTDVRADPEAFCEKCGLTRTSCKCDDASSVGSDDE